MRIVVIGLLLIMVAALGCGVISAPLGVVLAAPPNAGTVSPQVTVLTWLSVSPDTYQVQVSSDSSFQSLVVDASGVTNLFYSIPYGKLSDGSTYFWRVRAFRGAQTSSWTSPWYFVTSGSVIPIPPVPPTPPVSMPGTAVVSATLNGAAWSGPVNYTLSHYVVSGPVQKTGYSVPGTVGDIPAGNIQFNYNSGGPAGATLSGISPSAQQVLSPGGSIYYTMNFVMQQSYGSIIVNATLDGSPWQTAAGSGPISYTISGAKHNAGSSIPGDFSSQPTGAYSVSYNSGGPIGATFAGVSPSASQTLGHNGTIVFTLNFYAQPKGTVTVNATLNGEPWSGALAYVLTGPYVESGSKAPHSFTNAPSGTYSVNYSSGGPYSAVFEGVSPPSQYMSAGGHITFNIRFVFKGVLPGPLVE
jgi:hypothetical protein